ncbi:hypothetical protein GCM10028772_18520 [Nocardioides ultimimeridianus]
MGGGSSAVAASAHANCARFRGTDPLITRRTRRALAKDLGFPDSGGKIPEARWMRAMTFERLVKDKAFASRVATTAVGAVKLARPTEVVIAEARENVERTAEHLQKAHERAVAKGAATLVYGLAIPFVGYEDERATDVKPDFAVVAPTLDQQGSWLIMGDAKDYERVRSRIDDKRLLKGFLQVAVGAESARAWSLLPTGMTVHRYGVLAVPRNSFLQPEALVEDLTDHRGEVAMRIAERRAEAANASYNDDEPIADFVTHLEATFDPAACGSCTLFGYCRDRLRHSANPEDLLIEIGVGPDQRQHVAPLLHGREASLAVGATLRANVIATRDGVAQRTDQLRVDPLGQPGTINVALIKSDAASLGVHGMSVQRVSADGPGPWESYVFNDPQSPKTRSDVMKVLGKAINAAIADRRKADADDPDPIHLVVPDKATGDLLTSIADNMAGLELNRLRWERDQDMGRPQLTYNGDPAIVPMKLSEHERTAISFLLEEDRARAFTLRWPVLTAQAILARHLVAGGPRYNALRLDYLVAWAQPGNPVDHRALTDEIEDLDHTPGARLTSRMSDGIHRALTGTVPRKPDERTGPADPDRYHELVLDELRYKTDVLDATLAILDSMPVSHLRPVHRALEASSQAVWRRRLSLRASDLVRFGRTYRHWRNALVPVIQDDDKCRSQLLALANPVAAHDMAADAGNRFVAFATVLSADPIVLDVESRRIAGDTRLVLLHTDTVAIEDPNVALKVNAGSFGFTGLSIGPVTRAGLPDDAPAQRWIWQPKVQPVLKVGERIIVGRFDWFSDNKRNTSLNVPRPSVDAQNGPKPTCAYDSYEHDPVAHQWCCKPHPVIEAEYSDNDATKRAAGQLNPEVWPPVRDDDGFEVEAKGLPQGDPYAEPAQPVPDDVTLDDLDVTE